MKDYQVFVVSLLVMGGCTQAVKEIGKKPSLSRIGDDLIDEELTEPNVVYSQAPKEASFSTWSLRHGVLFRDKLARKPGDILTIRVSINDRAKLDNRSNSKRVSGRTLGATGKYGVAGVGSNANADFGLNSNSSFKGDGGTARSEAIDVSIAAVVTRTLGNGNLIVRGSQEIRVNHELRVLTIAGIVRPIDINPDNVISYERIAEARISYGGRGHISYVQQPTTGQQFLNRVLPF